MIDRNSPIPLYYQLKQHFKKQMEAGSLHSGDRLPTEMELCEQFDISRAPVRQALSELAREGLIYRRAGQGTFVASQAEAHLEQQTTLRVLAHSDVRWMASLEDAVRHWNRHHPEHEVRLDIAMCPRSEYHQVLRRAVAQGNAPDVTPLDYAWIADYAHDGYIVALDKLDPVWVDETLHAMELPVAKNNIINGHLYAAPVQADITGLWYRKDWLGQETLTPPQTWSDWLLLLDHFSDPAVQRRLGYDHAVALPVAAVTGEATVNLLMPFIWMAGGDIVNDAGELVLNSPEVYTALGFLQEITIQRRLCLPPTLPAFQTWDLSRLFAQGRTPMILGGTYEWSRIRDECDWAEDERGTSQYLGFQLAPRPSLETPSIGSLGGTSWAIFQQSTVQDLSLEILKLMASTELSTTFCEENLQISPYLSVNRELRSGAHPWLAAIVPLLERARTRPLLHNYRQISLFLRQMFEQILWRGMDVEETVQRTVQSLTLLLKG